MRSIPRTQLAVMEVLLDGRSHAYAIKQRLASTLGHSSVYAALAGAEAKGFVASDWENPAARPPGSGPLRKYYELTGAGRRALLEAQRVAVNDTQPQSRRTGLTVAIS